MPDTVHRQRNIALAMRLAADPRPDYLIGALAGINSSALAGIKSGRCTPSTRQMQSLADVLGVTLADLFEEA